MESRAVCLLRVVSVPCAKAFMLTLHRVCDTVLLGQRPLGNGFSGGSLFFFLSFFFLDGCLFIFSFWFFEEGSHIAQTGLKMAV